MPESNRLAEILGGSSERRVYPRLQVRSLSYIDLGDGNGGIILNLSEGGLAVQAVTRLIEDDLPHLRFQCSESRKWLETSGRITWKSESRKVAGVEFVNLSDAARAQIKEWIFLENLPVESRGPEVAASSERAETPSLAEASDSLLFIPEPVSKRPAIVPALKETGEDALSHTPAVPKLPDVRDTDRAQALSGSIFTNSSTLNPPKEAPPRVEDSPRDVRTLVALFVVLAIVSLFVGWAAGRVGLKRLLSQARAERSAKDSDEARAQVPSASPTSKVSEIEIQDLDNRTRLIPFVGPLGIDGATAQHGPRQQAPDRNFQGLVLSPPVRQGGSAPAAADREEPPVLTNAPPSGAFEPRSSIPTLPPPGLPPQQSTQHVGVLQQGRLIHRVEPLYPAAALEDHIEGTVKLHAVIGEDGSIRTLESVSGPDSLIDPAMNSVRQWRYTPTLLDGKPIQTDQDIFIVFRLPQKQ